MGAAALSFLFLVFHSLSFFFLVGVVDSTAKIRVVALTPASYS